MKNRILTRGLALVALASLSAPVALAQTEISADAIEKIEAAIPDDATVRTNRKRRLLIFTRTEGFAHGAIPYAAEALKRMGERTGAYDATVSDSVKMFEKEKLDTFDAIVFDNTTGTLFTDETLRANLMAFVEGGKGIVGIHAATDCFYDWPEFGEMMGGYFDGHPWNERVTIRVEDPAHPLNAAFVGRAFVVADEIYQFKSPYSRDRLRVLLSIDVNQTDMEKGGIKRDDHDFAVSWVRSWGEGRVFYCSLGHRNDIFWNPTILRHYLDGIQFALGDLEADTVPSAVLAARFASGADETDIWAQAAAWEHGTSRVALASIEEEVRLALAGGMPAREVIDPLLAIASNEEATRAGRSFACRQLARIGGDESVPVLSELLRDEELSGMARYALQRMPVESAGAALRYSLADLEGDLLLGVINSLGERRDDSAVEALFRFLPDPESPNPDWSLGEAAIEAIGKIGAGSAWQTLGALYVTGYMGRDRGTFGHAILVSAGRLAEDGEAHAAAEAYDYVVKYVPTLRLAAYGGLARLPWPASESVVPKIVESLEHADPLWIGTAEELIREEGDSEATAAYAEWVAKSSGIVRSRLIGALGDRGDTAATLAILAVAREAQSDGHDAAIAALGSIGDATCVPLLAEMAAAGNAEARTSLGRISADGVDVVIANQLRNATPAVQAELVRAVGVRRTRALLPELLALVTETPEPAVRIAAFESLASLGGRDEIGVVAHDLVHCATTEERAAGIDALVTISRRAISTGEDGVVGLLPVGSSAGTHRADLVRALGRIGGADAWSAVQADLAEGGDVAVAVNEALAAWPDGAPALDLLALAEQAPDRERKISALRGFARTATLPGKWSADELVRVFGHAVDLADDDEMRRIVLEGLGRLGNFGAVELAEALLVHDAVRTEAALAMIALAKSADGTSYEPALAAVERARGACSDDETVGKMADEAVDHIERGADYITAWRFVGPLKQDDKGGGALFDIALAPEPGGPEGEIAWQRITPDAVVAPGIVDFVKIAAATECVGYLECVITSPVAQDARLELGSDDGLKVWLNGEVVHESNAMRGLSLGSDVVTVCLQDGANRLLLKITQGSGDWRASCRLRSPEGRHLSGVEVSVPE